MNNYFRDKSLLINLNKKGFDVIEVLSCKDRFRKTSTYLKLISQDSVIFVEYSSLNRDIDLLNGVIEEIQNVIKYLNNARHAKSVYYNYIKHQLKIKAIFDLKKYIAFDHGNVERYCRDLYYKHEIIDDFLNILKEIDTQPLLNGAAFIENEIV